MSESKYTRIGRDSLIARLEAVDVAIARIRDRLMMTRRNHDAHADVHEKAKALARVQTYELVLAELGVADDKGCVAP